jgi:hypothetical protein
VVKSSPERQAMNSTALLVRANPMSAIDINDVCGILTNYDKGGTYNLIT